MPLSELQVEILRLLAAHRNPESYVAGATVLNQDGPRFSGDIDIFHDREESIARAAEAAPGAYTHSPFPQQRRASGTSMLRISNHLRVTGLAENTFLTYDMGSHLSPERLKVR